MNTLTDNNEENCKAENSSESPPQRRRRSSFFERRSIVPEPSMEANADDSQDDGKDDEHLNKYYAQLLREKELWKKEVKNRSGILHDTELQLKMVQKSDKMRINYSILSNDDIEFLRGKPDFTELVDSVKKLQKSTAVTYTLYKRLNELNDVILSDAEEKVEKITSALLENSTIVR